MPVICMTSKRLRGSVWVRLFENKKLYAGFMKRSPTKITSHKKTRSRKRRRLVCCNLYEASALMRPAIINGVFSMTKMAYLLTKNLQKASLYQRPDDVNSIPVILAFRNGILGIDSLDGKFFNAETLLPSAP
jgi:hypothetical protein